jgi:threonine synthase
MKFASLATPSVTVNFATALERGIAPDGSLYVPQTIPRLSDVSVAELQGASQTEIAFAVLWPWLKDELSQADLQTIIASAATFPTPTVAVGDKAILELFHGPTAAFKDVAARYLAAFMQHFNAQTDRRSLVLVATSGDTGGAIAQGFADVPGIRVVVLFPRGRVSELQREQLTQVADNVYSFEITGTFDDCQDLVKQAFAQPDLADLGLTSANSISIGRLLPQMTYYAVAALGQQHRGPVRFVVPSGNVGNLTAGVMARAMGFPIHSFLAANNANDLLARYLQAASAQAKPVVQTLATAMDVGRPNNLPRLVALFGGDHAALTRIIAGATISDAAITTTIRQVWETHHVMLDPHTAVAWAASQAQPNLETSDIIVATAAAGKFKREIEAATGLPVGELASTQSDAPRPARVQRHSANFADFHRTLLSLR